MWRHDQGRVGDPGLNRDALVAGKLTITSGILTVKSNLDRVRTDISVLETGNWTNESDVRTQPPDIVGILIPSVSRDCFHKDAGVACQTWVAGHECELLSKSEALWLPRLLPASKHVQVLANAMDGTVAGQFAWANTLTILLLYENLK
jgi:hypothetical protein